jgi:hypothetical protein
MNKKGENKRLQKERNQVYQFSAAARGSKRLGGLDVRWLGQSNQSSARQTCLINWLQIDGGRYLVDGI